MISDQLSIASERSSLIADHRSRPTFGREITVFTTRPDTIYGVTFFVLAPEHPLVGQITTPECRAEVDAYVAAAVAQSEIDRASETRPKTGIFTGAFVVNPLTGERIPVWVADYVLPSYGSGAIMGVPAHDARDFEFACKYGLPMKVVIAPPGYAGEVLSAAYTEEGVMVNSGPFDGIPNIEGIQRVAETIEARGIGRRTVQYRMRDWLISRQRYWGTPIPIIYCPACGAVPVPEDQLPVLLPPMDDFKPDGSGRSPLARLPEFVHTTCPQCSGAAQRETDTMGGFACSSWYFLRFTSPRFDQGPFEPAAMRYWMLSPKNAGVDIYVGGAEHAVLHLLYARFWTKVMADAGIVPFREPFSKLLNQGQLMGPDGQRMSKSRGNVITPDAMVATYGADALRVYELFMAPFDQDIAWSAEGINGARRFLNRVWNLYADFPGAMREGLGVRDDPDLERMLHKTIRQATERIEGFRFNTLISALMEFVNALVERQQSGAWQTASYRRALETLLVLLAPVAPHIAEELWQITGHTGSVHQQPWPAWDANLARDELLQIPVQVDGKVRAVIAVPVETGEDAVRQQALAQPRVQQFLAGREIVAVRYVAGKIVSVVTRLFVGQA